MALDTPAYKASIKAAFLAAKAETNPANFDAAIDALAASLSGAGEIFVKSGSVKTLVSTTVSTPDTINGTGSEIDAPGIIE